MHLYKTKSGIVLHRGEEWCFIDAEWDELICRDDLYEVLRTEPATSGDLAHAAVEHDLLPPIGAQEIWASGVTYFSSQMARIEESEADGGADFYRKVYHAERPELFFKSTAERARGHGQTVRIRRDSDWNVPEPELTLVISPTGKIVGYTVGNDMSSRSIEAENPLYLPQAKTYSHSAGIGPGILVAQEALSSQTRIGLRIVRKEETVFVGETDLSAFNRSFDELVTWLFKEVDFPKGVYLMTGTGIVPEADFSLQPQDRIEIEIESIGTLVQTVSRR